MYNCAGADGIGLEIHNLVNITAINSNYELAMRLSSSINNGDIFYTDLSGLQVNFLFHVCFEHTKIL